jgi:lipopolysaccharide transport system ATP-binding protein
MSDTAIRIEHLGKRYKIGVRTRRNSLRELIAAYGCRIGRCFHRDAEATQEPNSGSIWALKDISFEISHGEAVGIIGRNGAGKSTLLKVLSRITEPTEGFAEIHGRVGSLLEIGTGFHPELTGRENIYLNGAILGMRKAEIQRKFKEIVAFAEIEKFIDTPVKRYSSGMYVRLAFAVAAHLEPEILVVDEVLAVGDMAFQKKCLGKMDDGAKRGRTVLFVSHNMATIQQLCSRAILLVDGRIAMDGGVRAVVNKYVTLGLERQGERVWASLDQAPGDEVARMRAVRVLDHNGRVCTDFDVRDPIWIEMEYWVLRDVNWLNASFYLYNERGELLLASVDNTTDSPAGDRKRAAGFYRSVCHIPADLLNDGQIYIQANLTEENLIHTLQKDIVTFSVHDAMDPRGSHGNARWPWPAAAVRPRLQWTQERFSLDHAPKTAIPLCQSV